MVYGEVKLHRSLVHLSAEAAAVARRLVGGAYRCLAVIGCGCG